MPRRVTFVVVDEIGLASNGANVILNFNLIDNPPVLDLNGAGVPGNDYQADYREGSVPIQVWKCVLLLLCRDSIMPMSCFYSFSWWPMEQ